MNYFELLLLIFSLSIDLFFLGLTFGINHIKIQQKQNLFLNIIGTGILIIAILIGKKLNPFFKTIPLSSASSWIFLLLGATKLIQSIRKVSNVKANNQPNIIEDIKKPMSYKSFILLAITLSIDNITAGIGIGLLKIAIFKVAITSFLISYILLCISNQLGTKINQYFPKNNDWISGIILLFLGLLNL